MRWVFINETWYNITKTESSKGSMKGKLKRAEWDNAFLATLLANAKPRSRQMRLP